MKAAVNKVYNNTNNTRMVETSSIISYFWLFIIAEIIAAVILRLFVFEQYYELFINDAYIFLRYAENMANGNGLVYNLGEKVLGYSSPLYIVLLAGLKFISVDLPFDVVVLVLDLLLFILSGLFFALLIQNRGVFGLIFFTIFCFYFPYVDASVNGMGTMLMLTIIVSALYAFQKENIEMTYILGTIALIMRPEGSLFIASILIVSILLKRRAPSLISIIICASILLLWLVPTYLYFGNILPDSMLAKSNLFTGQQWSGVRSGFFEKGILLMLGFSDNTYFSFGFTIKIILWLVSTGIAILFAIVFFKAIKDSPTYVIAVIFFILLLFFYYLGSPVRMFSWYTIVPSIICMLVAIRGAEYLFHKKILLWLGRLSLGIIFLFCIMSVISGLPGRANSIKQEVDKDERLIHYLDKVAPGIKSIMISDIGYVGYWKKNWRIIDGSGLISPEVLTKREGENLSYLSDLFIKEKPDVIYLKVDILHSDIIKENMRYGTFRDNFERENFLNNYLEVSKAEDFAEIFIRKSLLSNPNSIMLK